jgi:hypothetical protein
LRYGVHKAETPITCTAGVGTYLLEFGALSKLTGKLQYERLAMKAMKELYKARSPIGLVGNHINVQTGVSMIKSTCVTILQLHGRRRMQALELVLTAISSIWSKEHSYFKSLN